jgi:hypothetical protein
MGYECPVCGAPQADERHLADHLAMTALTRGGDHEAWLDDHVPDWGETGPDELGPVAADHAAEREFPQVFEDTTGGDHAHGERLEDSLARAGAGRGDLTGEAAAALREAREMTAEMLDGADGSDAGDAGGPDGDDGSDDGEDVAEDAEAGDG